MILLDFKTQPMPPFVGALLEKHPLSNDADVSRMDSGGSTDN
jgi:hypothetical protein